MESIPLLEFLEKNEINWMPINLELQAGRTKFKKTLRPYNEDKTMPSYTDLSNAHLVVQRQAWVAKL